MTPKTMPPVHPGEILREEFLIPMGISANKLAIHIGVPSQRIYEILAGKRNITLDTALRLGKYFGTSHTMWLGLQADYEYQVAEDNGLVQIIDEQVRPMNTAQAAVEIV